MRQRTILVLALLLVCPPVSAEGAEEGNSSDNDTESAEASPEKSRKESGAEKRAARDKAVAELVEQHNEAVEEELDEVVCERVRITGTRRKVEVCKTRREILAEQESAQRMMMQRNRASSDPAQGAGMGNN